MLNLEKYTLENLLQVAMFDDYYVTINSIELHEILEGSV
jgi:hypothetical protein